MFSPLQPHDNPNLISSDIDAILSAVFPEPTSSPSPSKTASYPISSTRNLPTSCSIPSALNGYSLEPPTLTPIHSAPGTSADGTAILTRAPDIMALGEYGGAMDVVVGDLERMWKGFVEGRGGAREAGVRDLVSGTFMLRVSAAPRGEKGGGAGIQLTLAFGV